MNRRLLALAGGIAFLLPCVAAPARAQDSTAATPTQEAEWTVVEYPEGRETVVELKPTAMHPDARGTAKVTRSGEGTAVVLDVSGLGSGEGSYYLYAVSHEGRVERPDKNQAARIDARTTLRDFGLFITAESDLAANTLSGPVAALVVR